jgi:SSS family solute:Na+ symporter
MEPNTVILIETAMYLLVLGLVSLAVRRHSRTTKGFTDGGRMFPASLIGFLMVSEFIGTAVSVGTAQTGYVTGISAAWNVFALATGFALFAVFMARKYKELGINTISGVLAATYGEPTRLTASLVTICALTIISVSIFASGGAILANILRIDQRLAVIIVGVVTVFYVAVGGMRSVIYTNAIHAATKYLGVIIVVAFGLVKVGGVHALQERLPAVMFTWDAVGWGQICAWMIAGIGSIFATQQIVQAVHVVNDSQAARQASLYCAALMVPFGVGAALVGMIAATLHPQINPLWAFPSMLADMDVFSGGLVVAGLVASLLGAISAASMGCATLLLKDVYDPWFNPQVDDGKSVRFVRIATIAFGLVPVILALTTTNILHVAYLGKALRSSLAVLVLLAFYAPRFGTKTGAFLGLAASLPATISWYLLGDPFGVDNAYIAAATPLVFMSLTSAMSLSKPSGVYDPVTIRTREMNPASLHPPLKETRSA